MNFVKLLFMVLSTLILFSCTKESSDTIPVSSSESSPVDNYREQFAIILSKAIYENKSLCDFLKASALKQFDKESITIKIDESIMKYNRKDISHIKTIYNW